VLHLQAALANQRYMVVVRRNRLAEIEVLRTLHNLSHFEFDAVEANIQRLRELRPWGILYGAPLDANGRVQYERYEGQHEHEVAVEPHVTSQHGPGGFFTHALRACIPAA
jgi:hypothetical protein